MGQTPQVDLNALWHYVTDQVKARVVQPGLWRAMEAGRALAVEEDELVVGYGPAVGHQAGLLADNHHRNVIEQVLEAATRRRLRLRVFAGETLEEWEAHKLAQVEAARLQSQAREQFRRQAEAGLTWDAVSEQLVRKFGSMPNRGLASVQGRYLEEALEALVDAYGRLMPASPDEQDERAYSRAVERVAERVNVPAALVAQMVHLRRKDSQAGGAGS